MFCVYNYNEISISGVSSKNLKIRALKNGIRKEPIFTLPRMYLRNNITISQDAHDKFF